MHFVQTISSSIEKLQTIPMQQHSANKILIQINVKYTYDIMIFKTALDLRYYHTVSCSAQTVGPALRWLLFTADSFHFRFHFQGNQPKFLAK